MISGEALVYIIDVDKNTVDVDNGDTANVIVNVKGLIGTVDLVGLQTKQYGQSLGHNYKYSVEIPRVYYNHEKFCFFDNQLYEIFDLGKASSPAQMLLNVGESKEHEVIEAFLKWLEEHKNDIQ